MNAVLKIDRSAAIEVRQPEIPADEDLLTMKDIVARTKLHRATIYRLIASGSFPAGKATGPNSRRWTRLEIRAWIAS